MNDITQNKPIRLSRWVHQFKREEVLALYHALHIDVIYLPVECENLIGVLQKGTTIEHLKKEREELDIETMIDTLKNQSFIVPVSEDDMLLLQKKREEAIPPVGLHSLYLLLTDKCNLRCTYCFVMNSMPKHYKMSNMSWEVAKEAIDTFFVNLARNASIHQRAVKVINLYGGEPLLRFPLLKKVIEYTESTYSREIKSMDDVGFLFSLTTNGTLITQEIATFLASHPRVAITISLDGKKDEHNKARRTERNKDTFTDVIAGLRLLKASGCKGISISCVVDEHNIDSLESLLELNHEFDFSSINLNPLLDTEQEKVGGKYAEVVSNRMLEYFEHARREGVYEDRVMRRIKPFMTQRVLPYDCQATGSQLVCSPDGKLGVCHEGLGMKNYFFADVSKDFVFHENPVIQEWGRRSPLNMPQCQNCPAIAVCGGGCAYGAMLRNGSIWSLDDRFCIHSLKTLEWMIWDLHRNS